MKERMDWRPLNRYERKNGLAIDMTNGQKSVNPLRDEASLKRSGKNGIAICSSGKGLLNG